MVLEAQGPRRKIDWWGLGDFSFELDNHPGQNPMHLYSDKGHAPMSNIDSPREFVLTATFVRPEKMDLKSQLQPLWRILVP